MSEHKIEDGEEPDVPASTMPWGLDRISGDVWFFGLLMTNGTIVGIECCTDIRLAPDGSMWLDVRLLSKGQDIYCLEESWKGREILKAPTSRTDASINAAHVMAIVELADT